MAFSSGVFTSTSGAINGDGIFVGNKASTAAQLAYEKKMLYGNGISLDPTSAFYVMPKTGLTCTVGAGWGIMEGYWFRESADYDITMTSSTSSQTLYVGVRLDTATGEYTDSHVVARTTFVSATDRVFAIIVIPANAVTLTTAMITDTRYSTTYCGTINGQRTSLEALHTEYADKLAVLEAGSLPAHKANHAYGGSDALAATDIGQYGVAAINSNAQITATLHNKNVSTKTDSYTLTISDANAFILMAKATSQVITIPLNSAVAFPIGTEIQVVRWGAGALSIAVTAGVSLGSRGGSSTFGVQYSVVRFKKVATDIWCLFGDLA